MGAQEPLPPSEAPALQLTRRPGRRKLLADRNARQAKRATQFAVARWMGQLLLVAALAAGAITVLASTAPDAPTAVALAPTEPAVTIAPEGPPARSLEGFLLFEVHASHYWPALGGVNCFAFINGECTSGTSSGEHWQDWVGRGAACVPSWAFGTLIILPGGEEFTCIDRGGAIVIGSDNRPWIDLLVEYPPVPFGTILQVHVLFP